MLLPVEFKTLLKRLPNLSLAKTTDSHSHSRPVLKTFLAVAALTRSRYDRARIALLVNLEAQDRLENTLR
jgi:hypothetical protein